jgi:hypothetical protein
MIPAKLIGRYAFDSGKMNILKKKTPFSKLLPSNTSEKQMEKEINEAFAKVKTFSRYSVPSIYDILIFTRKWVFFIMLSKVTLQKKDSHLLPNRKNYCTVVL